MLFPGQLVIRIFYRFFYPIATLQPSIIISRSFVFDCVVFFSPFGLEHEVLAFDLTSKVRWFLIGLMLFLLASSLLTFFERRGNALVKFSGDGCVSITKGCCSFEVSCPLLESAFASDTQTTSISSHSPGATSVLINCNTNL